MATQLIQTMDQWEQEIAEIISEYLGMTYSDSMALIEAEDFTIMQSWTMDRTAWETAEILTGRKL